MNNYQPYMKLYRVMSHELECHDMEKPVSEEIYRLYLEMTSGSVDYQKIKHLSNEDFFLAAFLCILRRMPTEENYSFWYSQIKKTERETFQKNLIETLIYSREAQIKNSGIGNCPMICQHKPEAVTVGNKSTWKTRFYDRFHSIYMKLPRRIRIVLKRCLRKYFLGY